MEKILRLQSSSGTELPLTLVILDEMQQYIGEDNEKALAVQNIVEGCSARFQSQVPCVATGQSALTATPTLQKLTDRFAVQVALSDKDVESVVREVILRKRPEQVGSLKAGSILPSERLRSSTAAPSSVFSGRPSTNSCSSVLVMPSFSHESRTTERRWLRAAQDAPRSSPTSPIRCRLAAGLRRGSPRIAPVMSAVAVSRPVSRWSVLTPSL
jgi:hypothetical protein